MAGTDPPRSYFRETMYAVGAPDPTVLGQHLLSVYCVLVFRRPQLSRPELQRGPRIK